MKRYQLRSLALKSMEEPLEGPDALRSKVQELADMVRTSKYTVVYTGAGISTAAGIPDFRGPSGVWTLRAQGKQSPEPDFSKVEPTHSHVALKRLLDAGQIRHIISQNIDGLHLKSGILLENLSELHGNYHLEICPECKASYFRPFPVWTGLALTPEPGYNVVVERSPSPRLSKSRKFDGVSMCNKQLKSGIVECNDDAKEPQVNHQTGRKCEKDGCCGYLEDSVIHFWEDLPQEAMASATKHSQKADLGIVLGSSLKVTPACDLPAKILGNGGRVVIVNLQSTPLDARASLVIHAACDQVMKMLLEELSPPSRTETEDSETSVVDLPAPEDEDEDDLLIPLSWPIRRAHVKPKREKEKVFEEKNGRTLEFERPLLMQVKPLAAGS